MTILGRLLIVLSRVYILINGRKHNIKKVKTLPLNTESSIIQSSNLIVEGTEK